MPVDGFKFLPRVIGAYYQMTDREPELPIPWAELSHPLADSVFGLITSGGLYHDGVEPPFDLDGEKSDPCWGDPTYRTIPFDIPQAEVGASHLHINTRDVLIDINILLPVDRFRELTAEGRIGGVAQNAFSLMGYQGFPPDTTAWEETYGPEIAHRLKQEGVSCVLLTPA